MACFHEVAACTGGMHTCRMYSMDNIRLTGYALFDPTVFSSASVRPSPPTPGDQTRLVTIRAPDDPAPCLHRRAVLRARLPPDGLTTKRKTVWRGTHCTVQVSWAWWANHLGDHCTHDCFLIVHTHCQCSMLRRTSTQTMHLKFAMPSLLAIQHRRPSVDFVLATTAKQGANLTKSTRATIEELIKLVEACPDVRVY